jgi:hypothetical protein
VTPLRALNVTPLRALNIALLIERISRNFQAAPPASPPGRLQFSAAVRGLNLDQALHAVPNPPRYEFIREDEYFARVERLLQSLE